MIGRRATGCVTARSSRATEGAPDRRRAGFTLVELIVAMVLFSVGLLAVSTVLLGTAKWGSRVEAQLEVAAVAEAKLDDLREYAVAQTADTVQIAVGGSLDADLPNYSDTAQSAEGRAYIRRWQVVEGPVGTREVTLRVLAELQGDRSPGVRDFTTLVLIGF